MIDSNIIRIFLEYMSAYVIRILNRICTRISHMRYTVFNRMHIKIRILKPWINILHVFKLSKENKLLNYCARKQYTTI
jgi:hypothetical protein